MFTLARQLPAPLSLSLMADARKRHSYDGAIDADFALKKLQTAAAAQDADAIGDDVLAWLSGREDAVGELMELLDSEKTEPVISRVRFIDYPYSAPLIFQSSSSSYVTINGNEESCGSSFSDSDSSVMASVDLGTVNIARKLAEKNMETPNDWTRVEDGGEWSSNYEETRVWLEREEMDGCDGFSWDDDALARFIGEDAR